MTPEECQTIDDVRGLLRRVVRAPAGRYLVTVDWSQVEARGLHWLAGDGAALDRFRRGEDPYIPVAARVFRCDPADVSKEQRQAGKIVVLASGFGGGAGAVRRMAEKYGLDPATLGTSPQQMVEGYRDANEALAGERDGGEYQQWDEDGERVGEPIATRQGGYWRDLWRAFADVAREQSTGYSRGVTRGRICYSWRPAGEESGDVVCTLPSGRVLVYRDVRREDVVDKFQPPPATRKAWTYASPGGGGARVQLWKGVLVENCAQATCRDILTDAMLRLDGAGYEIVLHVHDEVVVEVDDPAEADRIAEICRGVPAWAEGFPIDVEAAVSEEWSK